MQGILLNSTEDDFTSRIGDDIASSSEGQSSTFPSRASAGCGLSTSISFLPSRGSEGHSSNEGASTSFSHDDVHQYSSPLSVADDVPSGSTITPIVSLMNSPMSVHNYGYHTLGQSVHNVSRPPPLVRAPTTIMPQSGHVSNVSFSTPVIQQRRPAVETQFWLCFVRGNISRCNGCKGKIGRSEGNKPLPPPQDVVFRHKESIVFQNPHTGIFQQSREPRNVYYHALKTCIAPHFLDFNPVHISIDASVHAQLSSIHLQHLHMEFELNL